MSPETLIALAYLISHKGTLDTTSIEAQLSDSEKAQVKALAESETQLPPNLEDVIKDTHEKISKGLVQDKGGDGS